MDVNEYLEKRVTAQQSYFSKTSSKNKQYYYFVSMLKLVVSLCITVISSATGNGSLWSIAISILSAILALAEGVLLLYRYPFHSFPSTSCIGNGSERKRQYQNYRFSKPHNFRWAQAVYPFAPACLPNSKDGKSCQGREARSLSLTAFLGFATRYLSKRNCKMAFISFAFNLSSISPLICPR